MGHECDGGETAFSWASRSALVLAALRRENLDVVVAAACVVTRTIPSRFFEFIGLFRGRREELGLSCYPV
jgi:hypothetical protein